MDKYYQDVIKTANIEIEPIKFKIVLGTLSEIFTNQEELIKKSLSQLLSDILPAE